MKIVLSTIGRFHIFPLARELERHGLLERVYSGFPWSKLAREGVSRDRVKTFPWVRPFLMGTRFLPFDLPPAALDRLHQLSVITLDRHVAHTLPEADVFVGHEAVGLISGAAAQRRGMVYVCDRGCSHMAWRHALLAEEYSRVGLPSPPKTATYAREIEEYERADLIVVPSDFVRQSFIVSGIAAEKVAVVPYGVNLTRFSRCGSPSDAHFDVIFVGQLSARKGASDLLDGFRRAEIANKRLTIVGTIAPEVEHILGDKLAAPDIRLLGHVPHDQLAATISNAHAFCLPSIEEGMAMVVAEAMACGCPPIITINTGNASLVRDGENGFIVPIRSPDVIAARLEDLAADPERRRAMGETALATVRALGGWESYGVQMIDTYAKALEKRRGGA